MIVKYITEGKTLYEVTTYYDGTEKRMKVRECNTAEEARALANYYRIRRV